MSTRGEEKSPWRIPAKPDVYHVSTDASLFSMSLPVLHKKLKFSESDQNGHSLNDGFPSLTKLCIEDDVMYPLECTSLNMTGSFLSGNENKLLAGPADDFDLSGLPTQLEDLDDDVFRSGGGLEIEGEGQGSLVNDKSGLHTTGNISGSSLSHYCFGNGVGTVSGEHPQGEHPSRTLFVRNINSSVEDSELRSLFEQYGEIRSMYTACKHRGFVMISYYDIRAAQTAIRELQDKPVRRRKLDIHFSIPKDNPSEKDLNQGTLVVFNLDPLVSNDDLHQIFGAYGEIKEIREAPYKTHHKFIEYYDVRAAEAALKALNRSNIYGKRVKLQPSRPGGARRSLMLQVSQEQQQQQDEAHTFRQQIGSPLASSPPGSWPNYSNLVDQNSLHGFSQVPQPVRLTPVGSNRLPGLASILPSHPSGPAKIAPIGKDPSRISRATSTAEAKHGVSSQQYFSVPGYNLSLSPGPVSPFSDFNPSSAGTLSGHEFLWGSPTIHSQHVNSLPWSSPLNGNPFPSRGQGVGCHSPFLGSHHHHIGSAPPGIQLDRNFDISHELTAPSYINASFGVTNFGAPGAMNEEAAFARKFTGNGYLIPMMPISTTETIYLGNGSLRGMGDGIVDLGCGKKADGESQMDHKKQYQLDLGKIINGEDTRTTLMIKNIPNKYTSKMLLGAIDETHRGSYDFLYLPIDFKNKCNVGYAFINMVSPSHILTFYKAFNGKKWESFNSEKVASLAYARIQGKNALISHFQNSSLMNEDRSCRPIVFQSKGQEYLPSANLNIFIRQPDGS